jgi:predicted RNase H-like HicB family nuclease
MRQVILYPIEDGWWGVSCPGLPGCHSQGATRDEALTNIKEAIDAYLESLLAHGEPVPEDSAAARFPRSVARHAQRC